MDLNEEVDIVPSFSDFAHTDTSGDHENLISINSPASSDDWEFAGWGETSNIEIHPDDHYEIPKAHGAKSLGQAKATSIAGNDITSSCLYVAGICVLSAGPFAPISLIIVCFVLYLFRNIYSEVVTALPLNGGCYNVLLNSTTKLVASFAACLTLISYVATAVVSADSAVAYFDGLWAGFSTRAETIILLALFAILNLVGISESANVALGIFVTHLTTMTILIIMCFISLFKDASILKANMALILHDKNWASSIFWGFSSALLGVSGFETSANYIEQQKDGVFPKTLRNMWACVSFFNPLLSFLSLAVLDMQEAKANYQNLLSVMGGRAGGTWLAYLVAIDAVMVLSGAVLTAYVGVVGLVRRMAIDRCLPQF
eukprot:TRINITY_DN9502_c0_g1_i1.p1 TRINITY_DN9502_c0_g1~~TRINITY_DN9502_c0_g1_i1.p1  ORF type:complete len:373 (+),score=86.85 TRINITY_DN9502_c0_g1_i1:90-1208(+)